MLGCPYELKPLVVETADGILTFPVNHRPYMKCIFNIDGVSEDASRTPYTFNFMLRIIIDATASRIYIGMDDWHDEHNYYFESLSCNFGERIVVHYETNWILYLNFDLEGKLATTAIFYT